MNRRWFVFGLAGIALTAKEARAQEDYGLPGYYDHLIQEGYVIAVQPSDNPAYPVMAVIYKDGEPVIKAYDINADYAIALALAGALRNGY